MINSTRALRAYSYRPITKASNENERFALAVPGEMLKDPIERLMEEVSDTVGEGDIEEERKDDKREEVPRGGLKMSLANSSWCIPRREAALWAAAGLMNLSDTLLLPEIT